VAAADKDGALPQVAAGDQVAEGGK
jgi:hypothetical protein